MARAPEMFVDLAAYRYLSARRDGTWTALVVSTSAGEGYVQRVTVAPVDAAQPIVTSDARPAPTPRCP